jgi:UDP-N-acetyl-D-mannosaminuronic acid dehydrogenase
MRQLKQLQDEILSRQAVLGVIGLGYVGLPVACMFAQAGFQVIGLDLKKDRIEKIQQGISPIDGNEPGLAELLAEVTASGKLKATTAYSDLSQVDIVLIDVDTPVDGNNHPQYIALRSACQSLGQVMKEGVLVIVESTIAPGTIDRLVQPLLEEASGRQSGEGFFLGVCPERVMPGRLMSNLRNLSRVCGGSTPQVAEVMVSLYRTIVEADLDISDPVTAELTKTAENAYRDVNIAFANELALICEAAGGDFMRVRELVNKSPGRNVLLAGAGVGGHCIPKDPWLLAYGAQGKATIRLIPAARAVNDSMPVHVGEILATALEENGLSIPQSRILILGYAYLENSDDARNSPSERLLAWLEGKNAKVLVHDPVIRKYEGDLVALATGCDAVVLMVAHREYKTLSLTDLGAVLRNRILIDGRGVFTPDQAKTAGFTLKAVGRG